jgi:hypothetical protein
MTRVEELASQFESITASAVQALEASDESLWQNKSNAEGWTVAALAHHFSSGLEPINGLVQGMAAGAELPPITPEMLEASNVANAQENAAAQKQTVVALLKQNSATALNALRQLNDEQLQRSADLFGNTVTTEQVVQGILIGHIQEHLDSFKATVG